LYVGSSSDSHLWFNLWFILCCCLLFLSFSTMVFGIAAAKQLQSRQRNAAQPSDGQGSKASKDGQDSKASKASAKKKTSTKRKAVAAAQPSDGRDGADDVSEKKKSKKRKAVAAQPSDYDTNLSEEEDGADDVSENTILSSSDMLVLRITSAHVLAQIEKRYSDEDEDGQGRLLLMATFLRSALERYISNDCPIIQDKFIYTESLSNVRNQGTTQTASTSSVKRHIKETKTPKNLEYVTDFYGNTHYSLLASDDKYKKRSGQRVQKHCFICRQYAVKGKKVYKKTNSQCKVCKLPLCHKDRSSTDRNFSCMDEHFLFQGNSKFFCPGPGTKAQWTSISKFT